MKFEAQHGGEKNKAGRNKAKETNITAKEQMTAEIANFQGEYFFLSNFYPSVVTYEGETYPTIEHAFQAAKALDSEVRAEIREANHPATAKQLGRRVDLRRDWEQVKYGVMLELLREKFRDPELRELLLATGDAELIEGNTWNDKIWGCVLVKGQWIGINHLGKLLMQVRGELGK